MAIIYGSQSKYLIRKEKSKARISQVALFIVFLISGFGLAATIGFVRNQAVDPNLKITIFSVVAFIFLFTCYKVLYAYSKNELFAKHYKQGSGGEDAVFAELEKLDNSYAILRDVVLKKGNLDFIAVRPNQVFCIEVKSHAGRITFNGDRLFRNGYPFREKDFIIQAWQEAKQLKDFLHSKMMTDVPVLPVLVFSDPKVWVDIDPWNPTKYGVYVLHARMLNKFLTTYKGLPININSAAIVEFLKPYVQ